MPFWDVTDETFDITDLECNFTWYVFSMQTHGDRIRFADGPSRWSSSRYRLTPGVCTPAVDYSDYTVERFQLNAAGVATWDSPDATDHGGFQLVYWIGHDAFPAEDLLPGVRRYDFAPLQLGREYRLEIRTKNSDGDLIDETLQTASRTYISYSPGPSDPFPDCGGIITHDRPVSLTARHGSEFRHEITVTVFSKMARVTFNDYWWSPIVSMDMSFRWCYYGQVRIDSTPGARWISGTSELHKVSQYLLQNNDPTESQTPVDTDYISCIDCTGGTWYTEVGQAGNVDSVNRLDAFAELAGMRIRVDGYDDWVLPERLITSGLSLVTEHSDDYDLLPDLLAKKKKKSTADDEESR